MKVYEFGNKYNPVIMLFPGTCCQWSSFREVIPPLTDNFYVCCVSYDGFDKTEDTVFPTMIEETEKIEAYIQEHFGGKVFAGYGCSLGGSFIGLLVSRQKIHMEHGIIGSSDMDQANKFAAKIMTAIITPIMSSMMKPEEKRGKLMSSLMNKKMEQADDYTKKFMQLMTGEDTPDYSYMDKKSMTNQFYSDLVTPLPEQISVPGTTIHVFYALKMGKKYRERYLKYFKDPDIIEFDLRHEELLLYPERWAREVAKACKVYETIDTGKRTGE